jgi:hypothetical protein
MHNGDYFVPLPRKMRIIETKWEPPDPKKAAIYWLEI